MEKSTQDLTSVLPIKDLCARNELITVVVKKLLAHDIYRYGRMSIHDVMSQTRPTRDDGNKKS